MNHDILVKYMYCMLQTDNSPNLTTSVYNSKDNLEHHLVGTGNVMFYTLTYFSQVDQIDMKSGLNKLRP